MPTREEKIAFLQSKMNAPAESGESDMVASADSRPVAAGGPTREEKIAFIKAKLAEKAPADDKAGAAMTALEHFGKGASLGYLPQLQAGESQLVEGAQGATDKVLDKIGLDGLTSSDYQLKKQGFSWPENSYVQERDAAIKRQANEAKDNPMLAKGSELAGGIVSGLAAGPVMPGANAARAATVLGRIGQGIATGAKVGGVYGAVSNPGDKEGQVDPLQLEKRAVNSAVGFGVGGLTGGVVTGAVEGIQGTVGIVKKGAEAAAKGLKKFAEKAAVNATGATGKQASEFSDDAGRELLDRGIVKFGDSQAKIAQRASQAVDEANSQIDKALNALEEKGVKVDRNQIYSKVREKITQLKGDESQADIARLLENEIDNVVAAADASGTSEVGISAAEKIKRGYNRKAGNWADPEKSQAGKEMYQTYRHAVEEAATAADPQTARVFEEGKKSYGLLAPIEEAAQRRAATTAQSPAGGLLDMVGFGAGAASGNPVKMVAVPVGRRVIAPRLSSSLAVSADKLANVLRKIPHAAELEAKDPGAFQGLVNTLLSGRAKAGGPPRAADDKVPTKGRSKWVADGYNKLLEHTSDPKVKEAFQKAKSAMTSDPKKSDLLIQASSFKPGSKAMDQILAQLTPSKRGN